ncbi:hypothetical protein K7X08_019685 [Anisodus acutangulus]|uniref:K Homology domain-containing protein n=1 Tax=Anisodus acutangulus TaxID=402998 RepID=A0A9Q1RPQ7_9SOLA|nr:hypothetical protein K7X08_019685 [Anisodus acutangulus]
MGHRDLDYVPPHHAKEAPTDFTMKIMCSAAKIGSVIGKGGFNVKQLQQETGASIHVEDVSPESDERVIRVSSLEALWDPGSQTIDAILQLQHKTSEISDKGIITTRLLVPPSKVGCILGQGDEELVKGIHSPSVFTLDFWKLWYCKRWLGRDFVKT